MITRKLVVAAVLMMAVAGSSPAGEVDYVAIPLAAHGIWGILQQTPLGVATPPFLSSRCMGEDKTGVIVSPEFSLSEPRVRVCLRGWDSQAGGAGKNRVELVDTASGEVLHTAAPPQTDNAVWTEWDTANSVGRQVRVRVGDGDTNAGFAWLGLEAVDAGKDFQANFATGLGALDDWTVKDGEGKDIGGEDVNIDGIPFKAAAGSAIPASAARRIELGFRARRLFVLGLSNSIDWGCPVWAPVTDYSHRYFIGDRLGEIRVEYAGGDVEVYPLILGDSMWWGNQFAQHPEPFASDPATVDILAANLKLYPPRPTPGGRYLACIEMREEVVESVELVDLPQKAGVPVVAALTAEVPAGAVPEGTTLLECSELKPELTAFVSTMALSPESAPPAEREARLDALRDLLYTTHENFPQLVAPSFPEGYRGPRVRFEGNAYARVLTNVFHYNLKDMDERVDERGMYHTSAKEAASWGGYFGFGTWNTNWGSYYQHSWARDMGRALMELVALGIVDKARLNADYAILMGRVWDEGRMDEMPLVETHGLKIGPFDIDGHDIPYHWSRILNIPSTRPNTGCFDNDSHGLTMMSVYNLWRRLPNRQVWLEPRWKYLVKAGDWIKWQFDNPEISGATDLLIQTESESSHGTGFSIYPDYTCMDGLRGFAEMADSLGETAKAAEWRATADRLRRGMARDYPVDDERYGTVWTLKHAGWPHQSTVLAPVILAPDRTGFAPEDCDQEFRPITERSYQRLIDAAALHTPRYAYGGAMGYSQGFVTQAALLLDRMDEAGEMLRWTARFVYYNAPIEAERYLVPEGAEVIPSGEYWHRIGDLGNGVQQAETIKTLRLVMGVDNTGDHPLRLFPRLPYDWSAIHVEDHPVWIEHEGGARQATLSYDLTRAGRGMRLDVRADHPLPAIDVRLGALKNATPAFGVLLNGVTVESRTERSGDAVWVRLSVPAGQRRFTVEVR